MCDTLRDSTLVDLGVRLEDKPSGAVWKRDDPDTLKHEVTEKRRAAAAAARRKVETGIEAKRTERSKAQAVVSCSLADALAERFKLSADEQPTHVLQPDGTWQELEAKQLKSALKAVESERKKRAPLLKKLQENPALVAEMDASIAQLEAQLEQMGAEDDA